MTRFKHVLVGAVLIAPFWLPALAEARSSWS